MWVPGSGSDFPCDLDKSFTASIMKQKEVIFTYLRGTVKLKHLKGPLPMSLATYVSFIFVCFHIELCLVSFFFLLFPQCPLSISTIVIFTAVESNALWLVICHSVDHLETLHL